MSTEHDIAEIQTRLQNYVSNKNLSPHRIVELYCVIHKRWGYAQFNEEKKKYTAIIEEEHNS